MTHHESHSTLKSFLKKLRKEKDLHDKIWSRKRDQEDSRIEGEKDN